jgi:hypothetical protein
MGDVSVHHPAHAANGNGSIDGVGIEKYVLVFTDIYHSSKWSGFLANWYWLV